MKSYKKPLLGFRRWSMNWKCELSPAAVDGHIWTKGLNKAVCRDYYSSHESPGETCHCGFNAWFKLKEAEKHYNNAEVLGAIAGAGNTRVHRKGFRCSEAQIIALLVPADFEKSVDRLEKDYGVPVFVDPKEFLRFVNSFDLEKKKTFDLSRLSWSLRLRDYLYLLKAIGVIGGLVFGLYYAIVAIFLFIAPETDWGLSETILTVTLAGFISIVVGGWISAGIEETKILDGDRFAASITIFCTSFVIALLLSLLVVIPTFKPENTFGQQVIEARTKALTDIAGNQEKAYSDQGYFWGDLNSSLEDNFLLTDDQKDYGFKEEDFDLSVARGQQSYSLAVSIPEDKNDLEMTGTMTLEADSGGYDIVCEPEKACE